MEHSRMDYFCDQVPQKDVGRRMQVGQEFLEYLNDPSVSTDLEQDQQRLDKVIDELTGWVNSSNYKVSLLGLDLLGAFVDRLSGRFKSYIGPVLIVLMDRMGDAKDQVRDQAQNLALKLMDQAAQPMFVWERLVAGFKHKNYRSREGVCLCLIATLNTFGAQSLILNKLVPHLCILSGDSNSQVRDAAILAIVEIYRHVGEKVRVDLNKRGLPSARLQTIFMKFDEVKNGGNMISSNFSDKSFDDEESVDGNRPSSAASAFKVPAAKKPATPSNTSRKPGSAGGPKVGGTTKEGGAGAVDEDDFIKAFTDVPTVQIYSSRELEETLNKIREILSDDKHDWDQRASALKKVRSLLVAGAAQYDGFFQHLRLLDGAFKLSAKDLRSQVVREACITVAHLSTVLGNKFDHGAESIVPTLFNLVPNSAKVMATSGCAAIRFIIRHTHVPRLIPLITSNCTSKSVAVRRRSFEFLDLLLQEWQTHSLERHAAVLVETIKKGIHDADAEARVEARKTYLGLRNHFPGEAEVLYNNLEPSYQRSLHTYLKNSGSIASLPQSDRSSSSSQESLNRPFASKWSTSGSTTMAGRVAGTTKSVPSPGMLQRSRSDIDVNAAAGAKARHAAGQPTGAGRLAAAGLPPGSYASLEDTSDKMDGRVRTKLSAPSIGMGNSKTDSRGRSRTKVVSQSQRSSSPDKNEAGSRSGSPGRVLTTTTLSTMNTGVQRVLVSHATAQKRSKIPRSQGCSREASPSRLSVARGSRIPRPSVSQGCSREASRESSRDTSPVRSFAPLASRHHSRSTGALYSPDVYGATGTGFGISQSSRLSSSVSAMRVLNTGSDVEEAVADALKKPVRRRYESYGMYSDDDANSDASSACSERSYSSRNGTIPTYMRQTEDVAEVLNRCASSNWSERKEGLLGLQNLLKNQRTLSRVELKRLCEIFTRMFADPHSKVFSMFLETLVDFIQVHKEDLQDWLFVLLTQLLKKMGADLLGSVQAKVQKALDVTRESFPNELQFNILMRFTVDQTQTPSLKTVKPALQDQLRSFWSSKVKVAILKYIETLAQQMDPGDFINSSETRLAVSRIITWTTEPKSSDVRKAAQSVLISLFELNTPEFTMLLGALPKTFQDGATKLLHNHLRNTGNGGQGSMGSPLTRPVPRSPASWSSPITSPTNTSQNTLSPSAFDYDTENMNSEDIYSSLRGVTEAIQNFSFRSQEDMNEPMKRDPKKEDGDSICSGSGIVDLRAGGGATDTGRTALDNKTSLLNTMPSHSSPRSRDYNPYNYSDSVGSFNKSALKEAMFDDDAEQFPDEHPLDHSDLVAELLKELSNHNERVEERKAALYELMKLTQEESFGVWDEHFKTILLLLLETLGDKEHAIRALALKVLREILRHQPARFRNYAELTIMKTLEAHKDPHKEVVRSAEEAATMLATSISPDQCIKVLCPIIQTADYPINLAAIKMQTKVIERVPKETLAQLLPEIVPGLIQGYDNSESSVRKACVFCLVAIHAVIGDELKPHLSQLTGSKMKLLNLYIKRAQTGSGAGDSAADVPGQS
ncbi:CLIP-associating protein 2 isoform X5 [Podarcis raffonei]|uniref:CLIP-associating protein 2 isoform X5 n=1 Tax=Podarcis raffonei TaxID=65483 RepID=UPI002329474F|nr:CLIP-associating protein 2 isoform X5 [Podarcis raffonei]